MNTGEKSSAAWRDEPAHHLNMKPPKVSILMAVYNGEKWLQHSLPSVLEQDFGEFEFIIVDDGSTDNTADMVRSINDPRVVYVRNEVNIGQTASLNVALARAQAPLIARIDADDLWLPGKLSAQVAYMESRPDVAVLGTGAYRIDNRGLRRGPANFPRTSRGISARLFRCVPVCHVSVVMRREAAVAAGGYPEKYRFAADFGLWSVIARAGGVIANLPQRLTLFREDPQTFGAAQKAGVAGDETAAIIQKNALHFAGIVLSFEECRDMALLFFPQAERSLAGIARAYCNLKRLDATLPHPRSVASMVDLLAVLMWALARRWGSPAWRPADMLVEWFWMCRYFLFSPGALVAVNFALLLSLLGVQRAARIKSWLLHCLPTGGGGRNS